MNLRLALVTGGIGGLGTAICRRLAQRGNRVIAVDLGGSDARLARFLEAMSGLDVSFEAADVGDPDACERLLQRVAAEHGAVDILVNAAGITRDARLTRMDRIQWDEVLRVRAGAASVAELNTRPLSPASAALMRFDNVPAATTRRP